MSNNKAREARTEWLTLEDRVDLSRVWTRGRLIHFSLNYRTKTPTGWKAVTRYDTHHRKLHVHRFWRKPKSQVESIEKKEGIKDYEPYYQAAKEDIETNWARYRRLLARKDGEEKQTKQAEEPGRQDER